MSYIATCRARLAALQAKKEVNILAIESSCDETAAAVIQNGRKILSSAVFTQIPLHAVYGGVVPEIASRAHVDAVDRMVDYALNEAGMKLRDVDAIGVTYGPGLEFWTDGMGSGISAGYDYCRWFFHLCA